MERKTGRVDRPRAAGADQPGADPQRPGAVRGHARGGSDEAKAIAEAEGASELCIIGGGEIFRQLLDQASDLYLTWVDAEVPADAISRSGRADWRK
jgi:dihydrofolate reductase